MSENEEKNIGGAENISGNAGDVNADAEYTAYEEPSAENDIPDDGGEESTDPAERAKRIRKEVFSWIRLIVIVLAAVFVVKQFVIVNAVVPTTSMQNLIDPGDRLIGFRLAYVFGEPQRYDVVIFKYPVDEEQNYIKRVIGLPGETVTISDGEIYIDDSTEPLDEPYLPEEWVDENDGYTFVVPEDSYFVLGDNRNVSLDARFWAEEAINAGLADTPEEAQQYTFVKKNKILGKAIFKYWPHIKSLLYSAE